MFEFYAIQYLYQITMSTLNNPMPPTRLQGSVSRGEEKCHRGGYSRLSFIGVSGKRGATSIRRTPSLPSGKAPWNPPLQENARDFGSGKMAPEDSKEDNVNCI